WVGIGAFVGWVAGHASSSSTSYDYYGNPVGTVHHSATGAVITGMLIAGALAGIGILYTLTSGAKLVLSVSGAKPADPQKYLQLHNIVETLAIGDGLPKPDVYVIEDPSPNAFATGSSPKHAAITVTSGLLEMMNREELEGVIGHEMSHI